MRMVADTGKAAAIRRVTLGRLGWEMHGLMEDARRSWRTGHRPWIAGIMCLISVVCAAAGNLAPAQPFLWRAGYVYANLPVFGELERMPLSIFLPSAELPLWGAILQTAIVIGLAEMLIGHVATVLVAGLGQLLSTLAARYLILLGTAVAIGLPLSQAGVLDTGPSGVSTSVGGWLLARRKAYFTLLLLVLAIGVATVLQPDIDGREHATALAVGVAVSLVSRPWLRVLPYRAAYVVGRGFQLAARAEPNTLLPMTDDKSPAPELRASHADRDRVAEQLRDAAGDGRLTMEELDERLERALGARTGSELALLVRDLPATSAPSNALAVPVEAKDLVRIETSSGSATRQGAWVVPKAMEIKVGSGSAKLDFRDAVITGPVLRVEGEVRSGSITFITKPGIEVVVDEVSVKSGSAKVKTPKGTKAVPTVLRIEVTGSVRSGSITARPPYRGFWAWLTRRPRPGWE